MLKYKNNNQFKNRVKFDKPVIQKNSNDFNDSDIDSNLSFDDNNNINKIEIENGQPKTKGKSILKKSNSKTNSILKKNKPSFKILNKKENDKDNHKKEIIVFDNDFLYSDKEGSDEESRRNSNGKNDNIKENKEVETNKKIEKELILSITNKEIITRERLNLAEKIKFRDEPDKIIFTDEYGFLKNEGIKSLKSSIPRLERLSCKKLMTSKSAKELLQINARIEKWNYMLQHYEEFSTKKKNILKSRTRKGIPDSLRGYIWQLFAEKKKYYIPNLFKNLENQPVKKELELIIMKDLDRTFPLCYMFREKYGNGQRKLYKVLSSYSKYNTEVGYVQGMGFMAAIFLIYMNEESSFFMLHSLMKKYKMEDIFFPNFPGLRKKFFILLNLQKKYIPKIYNIFQRDGVLPTMYASTWFISLFARSVDFHIVVRIFDCFFLEGFKVIYRISLALLKLKENDFCQGDKGCSLPLLQTVLENVNVEQLFKTAFGFSISRNYINKIEAEYEKVQNDQKNEFIAQLFF